MDQEKYNLNWHTYSDHLRKMLHEMMKSNDLTDVTLVCDDKIQFKAHKIVLSACSSVFKSIINDLSHNTSVIYLRGIQHQEMESILEFMYLGVATFYQERMNEFLNVAKNLEIKEIGKDVEFDDENVSNEEAEIPYNETNLEAKPQTETNTDSVKSMHSINSTQSQKTSEGNFNCDQCEIKFTQKRSLIRHIQSKHEGAKYACNQCDQQFARQSDLRRHTQSVHEGVKYACYQCDQQYTQQGDLKKHIQSVHEGMKYACNQCDYQTLRKDHLNTHINLKHL